MSAFASLAYADSDSRYNGFEDDGHGCYDRHAKKKGDGSIQLGPRPFYLVKGMDDGDLKTRLLLCQNGPFHR
ncbi:MAG: glycerophosphodiester phosphodiesterase family protein, partial [Vicinamibacterales bacterium]